ncbi:HAD-IA family hydrolase [Candidatus Woesearchaeota archaeon]|nr:HAD-IA family hydrolase [Candidatus Woesearchaeota archaeon]
MIRCIIFDLNGVFLHHEPLIERLKKDFHIPVEECLSKLKQYRELANIDLSKPFWGLYLQQWNIPLTEQQFFEYWVKGERLDKELFTFVKGLNASNSEVKIIIFSNNFQARTELYKKNFPELFCWKIYFSWQIRLKKPSKESFEHILAENKCSPEECLFFDDSETNVLAAASIGIKSYLYKSLKETKEIILQALPQHK